MTWPEEKYKIMEGTVRGLAFLHNADFYDDNFNKWEHCVVHRDLKPANILVTDRFVPKISDFGCSRFKRDDINMTQIGTPIYAAPEVILGQRYDEKADIYSFAIVLVGLAHDAGNLDTIVLDECARVCKAKNISDKDARNTANVMKQIAEGMRPPLPDKTPPCIAEIIGQCWQGQAVNRPSSTELLHLLTHVTRPQLIHQAANPPNKDASGEPAKYDVEEALKEGTKIRANIRRKSDAMEMPAGVAASSVLEASKKQAEADAARQVPAPAGPTPSTPTVPEEDKKPAAADTAAAEEEPLYKVVGGGGDDDE